MTNLHRLALLSLALFSQAAICDVGPTFPLFTPAAVPGSPVRAEFVDLGSINMATSEPCDMALLAVVDGQSTKPLLRSGEVAIQRGPGAIRAYGWGHALAVLESSEACDANQAPSSLVVTAPDVPWADARHEHLDTVPSRLQIERLVGNGRIPPHRHAVLREVLCLIEGAGTLILAGVAHHLTDKQCLQIPPSTEHAWTPDSRSTPKAFRLMVPSGPALAI